MNYAERKLIKQRSLNKSFKERLLKTRYECYKDIIARNQECEIIGIKEWHFLYPVSALFSKELLAFVVSLEKNIRLDYRFFQDLKDEVEKFFDELLKLSVEDLPAMKRFVRNYKRNETLQKRKEALQSAQGG